MIPKAMLVLFLCTIKAFSQSNQPPTPMQSQLVNPSQQLVNLQRGLAKATREKNDAPLKEGLHPAFVFTTAQAKVLTKEEYLKGFALNPAIKLEQFNSGEEKVTIIGNTAIVTALFHIKFEQQPNELLERTTATYIKSGEQWQMVALQATLQTKP